MLTGFGLVVWEKVSALENPHHDELDYPPRGLVLFFSLSGLAPFLLFVVIAERICVWLYDHVRRPIDLWEMGTSRVARKIVRLRNRKLR